MNDPRFGLFLRSTAGLVVMAGLLWWLWNSGRVRAARLFGSVRGDIPAMAVVTWICAVLTLAAMLLGTFGALHPLSWLVLALGGGLVLRLRTGGAGRDTLNPPVADESPSPSWPFVVGASTLVLGRLIYGLRNPPADVDSILYHMPMVAHWMATGGLGAASFEPQQIGSFYPGNVEVLALGFAWLVGRETLMTVPGVLSLGLLALALRRLAIEAGAKTVLAETLALALACAPGVLQLTLGLRVENVMAAWFAVALLFALRARRGGARGDVEITLCSLGLLAGCKATGPALALFVGCVLLVGKPFRAGIAAVRSCRAGLIVMAVTGGFWMLRNVLAAGNPVYPAGITLGSWTLPGLAGHANIATTSQFAMWRHGLAGNFTLANLWRYFGPVSIVLVPAAVAGALTLLLPHRPSARRGAVAALSAIAVATIALTIFQPFSGANAPEFPGGPLTFSAENVRYIMPALIAVVPLAAVGLSTLPTLPVVLTCVALASFGVIPRAGHLAPALVVVLLLGAAWASRPRTRGRSQLWRVSLALLPCAILAAGVTLAEPTRERMTDRAWDTIIQRFDSVPAAVAREVRTASVGRPIAVAGAVSIWALYGRQLDGRPEYVPVGHARARSDSRWKLVPDLRDRADVAMWMQNLKASGARFVVLVTGEGVRPVERSWCERDPGHFTPVYVTAQRAVYRVTGF